MALGTRPPLLWEHPRPHRFNPGSAGSPTGQSFYLPPAPPRPPHRTVTTGEAAADHGAHTADAPVTAEPAPTSHACCLPAPQAQTKPRSLQGQGTACRRGPPLRHAPGTEGHRRPRSPAPAGPAWREVRWRGASGIDGVATGDSSSTGAAGGARRPLAKGEVLDRTAKSEPGQCHLLALPPGPACPQPPPPHSEAAACMAPRICRVRQAGSHRLIEQWPRPWGRRPVQSPRPCRRKGGQPRSGMASTPRGCPAPPNSPRSPPRAHS